jgi:anti-sigma-K factor RskA
VDVSRAHEEFIDLCAGHALGSLDEAERKRLEEHLASGCDECEAALAEFSATTVLLAASAPAARPSPHLRERVLGAIHGEREREATARRREERGTAARPARRRGFPWGAAYGWAAAACLAVALFVFARATWRLRSELAGFQQALSALEQRLLESERWAAVSSAPAARVAALAPTPEGSPDLRARATLDPGTRRAILYFDNLHAPSGRDYELWAIRGTGPASLGVIKADDNGHAVVRVEDVGDPATLNAFAVSLEPAGGSPTPTAPTGPVVMVGALGG